jgi:hypothetical protein
MELPRAVTDGKQTAVHSIHLLLYRITMCHSFIAVVREVQLEAQQTVTMEAISGGSVTDNDVVVLHRLQQQGTRPTGNQRSRIGMQMGSWKW